MSGGGGMGAEVFGGTPMAQLGQAANQQNAMQQMMQEQIGLQDQLNAQQGNQAYGNWAANQAPYNSPVAGIGAGVGAGIANPGPSNYPAPRTLEDAGTSWGELTGYRIWRVIGGYLASFSAVHAWVPGEPMRGMPSDYGSDGVWAFKEKSRALFKALETPLTVALGSVRMWGVVIEHTQGYRAEYATVAAIDLVHPASSNDDRLLAELRCRYGV